MFSVLIEFMLSFVFISYQLHNVSNDNLLVTNIINKQVVANYANIYKSYITSVYNDSVDNSYFEKFLWVKDDKCDEDNTNNWDNTDPLDWCLVYFTVATNEIYKYKWQISSLNDINKNAYLNKFIADTFITVKKDDDKYVFNIFNVYSWRRILLWDFIIKKN